MIFEIGDIVQFTLPMLYGYKVYRVTGFRGDMLVISDNNNGLGAIVYPMMITLYNKKDPNTLIMEIL